MNDCDCGHAATDHHLGSEECTRCSCTGVVAPVASEGRTHAIDDAAAQRARADALAAECEQLRAENTRFAAAASQAADLAVERNHYRGKAHSLAARFDWAQSVGSAAMRQGLAMCRGLRGVAERAQAQVEFWQNQHATAVRVRDEEIAKLREALASTRERWGFWQAEAGRTEQQRDAALADAAGLRAAGVRLVHVARNALDGLAPNGPPGVARTLDALTVFCDAMEPMPSRLPGSAPS